ncbi:MAG TPA: hypothetical protein VN088_13655 [Nocardioides sp.]|nr:hypothetical protein [Nocardioides sp.]
MSTDAKKDSNVIENRLEDTFDAVLHLQDRQILDAQGRMAGNVDDVELADLGEGIEITGLLVGTSAFVHRIGGRVGARLVRGYGELRVAEPHRTIPWRVPLDKVQYVDSAVHLGVDRDGMLERGAERLRLGDLTGMRMTGERGKVIDARFEPRDGRLLLRALVVGRGGPGSLLGYERRDDQGPWVVAKLIRAWHRHTRVIDVDEVSIDWSAGEVNPRQEGR